MAKSATIRPGPTLPGTMQPFMGMFEALADREARGWAIDTRPNAQAVRLHVLVDRQEVDTIFCDRRRDDVQAALGHPHGRLGFLFKVPDRFVDGEVHALAFRFADRSVVPFMDPATSEEPAEELEFILHRRYDFASFIDGMKQGALRGWVQRIDPDTRERVGGCRILLTANGAPVAQARADRYRGDVAAALGGDPNCGFEIVLPPRLRRGGAQTLRFMVTPDEHELSGSPLTTLLVDDALEARLLGMQDIVDRLYGEIVQLRTSIADVMPTPSHSLGDYDRWARHYYVLLRGRAGGILDVTDEAAPLVSILCPTWRPLLSDFEAAVGSVLAQTWRHWELIIIDDGGGAVEITARIEAWCKADSRIRCIVLPANLGISAATNAGLEAARGEYVAFFDHDDLLVDVAIEVMVAAAAATGAQVLYSDEDKIDQAGYFLEPNLKPDWNYRYLLGCNYVCHLLFVRTATLRAVGPLRAEYDGAQDHDLILRLAEAVPASGFHHVPEILYHWRKTPNSTAVDVSKKGYAIEAGIRCVSDHLKRRGIAATVRSIRGLTLYGIEWLEAARPSVAIIVPYKDQIQTTRRCIEALLAHTDYGNFEIILVDNWSVTREAIEFRHRLSRHSRVRFITVEEEFNFSRLNNIAAAQSDADFLVFMNNDVFVSDPSWLATIVAEAQALPEVAIVGGKFLYPNGTIQHAGVVVGPDGVASHAHRGLPATEYGYIGRAMLSHEVSAVTAAGMLIRASVFREVGGFDEGQLKIAYNDVDLCLKVRMAGYRVIWCAEFVAAHHESLSRGSDDQPANEARFFHETQLMLARWGNVPDFRHDPFYSRFFTVQRQNFFDLVDPASLATTA
ncbi:glycosyltransferase family 2 protein [Lichenicoccus roseus]|nr:glycosyltransferase family 2 protein [Lichenicoccus roseus]